MNRVLPVAFTALVLSAPAFGQTVDSQGAKQLSDDLSRYVGKQALDTGILKVSVEGDAYKIVFDFKTLAGVLPKQEQVKLDFAPYALLVKPRSDGTWDVSMDFSQSASFEFKGPEGPQSTQFSIKDGKGAGVYDPNLAAFVSGTSSIASMTMASKDAKQQIDVSAGAGTATIAATKAANGGVDFTTSQKISNFVEAIKFNDSESGLNFPVTVKSPELSVEASGKGVQTKPLLDLLAFAVANEDEKTLKANQAQLKSLLLAALPVWERIDGTYGFKDFAVDSPIGTFGATQLSTVFGADGVAQNGKVTYGIKVAGLTVPQQLLPSWSVALLPTDIDLNFGGANIDLDSMAKKAIEAFDLNQDPPLSAEFGDQLKADFLAKAPKVVIGHSIVKNKDMEIALEGEMTSFGEKPDANLTVDVAGFDKIMAHLQDAAKAEPELGQYVPVALMAKGFAKTLPDGRLEWAVSTKADGSVTVNGVMLKPADPAVDDSVDDGNGADDSSGGDNGGGDNGGAGAKLNP
ncbi:MULTISPECIES: hypothetical protein [Mesorhizobium]|uniref:Uncharacterized protein n=1 Tax=Rhizobium loti TaxID=381 RepID=A0A6M7U4Y1_RHILI|nr:MULTISPECIES: hypothetical protein [Mesorhizobium]KRB22405.1 hypothetical protein ASE05_14365 [Mesorhizobium sp. Root172]OBQ62324.1 hypothetical protein A8145_22055 [Mesorhizobium loti]QKC71398.1 hypothetical protein EB815_21375 [Mesorhizobium loti]